MKIWTIIVMIILLIAIGVFVLLTFLTESSNKKKQQSNILYPFSGYLSPPGPPWTVNTSKTNPGVGENPEDGMYLVGMGGGKDANTPQIQCPVGYKINIVGAFLDITDPYGECSNNPDPVLKATCGNASDRTSLATCRSDNDCGAGMTCYGSKCIPRKCFTNADCGGISASGAVETCDVSLGKQCVSNNDCGEGLACIPDPSGPGSYCAVDPGFGPCMACISPETGKPGEGYCASMPTCAGVSNGLNATCSPLKGDTYKCRPRDASAFLAAHCDGKQTCLDNPADLWNPNTPGGVFGPLPCHISADSGDTAYSSLPIVMGWGGGTPNGGSKGSEPANFNQGYSVHGIYTCVPDDENTTTS